jgi:hypothetical protein
MFSLHCQPEEHLDPPPFINTSINFYHLPHQVRLLEQLGSALAADRAGVVPTSLRPAVIRIAEALGSSELYTVGREVVMCPAATHV